MIGVHFAGENGLNSFLKKISFQFEILSRTFWSSGSKFESHFPRAEFIFCKLRMQGIFLRYSDVRSA
ncbi:hypothetical protein DLM75_09875 [Leptospira stimsonii]|uniref:Uncharacterized protein n=1 Tax=Leptospira stimsonii TaxID=2202203 RepID=A0A396Z5D1_9LEPT|nr:hypothetical protein DLM75_09875 [Leptospira stimsonii]